MGLNPIFITIPCLTPPPGGLEHNRGEVDNMAQGDKFGILLPTRGVLVYAGSNGPRVEQVWQMAETAERAGYDSVWVGDSVTSKPRMEPLTAMAAVAARTSRVKIGTAVLLNALRHPVHLAHAAATIDNISGGRTILGLGAGRGNNQMFVAEHAAVGVPITERASRMEESICAMRALWSGVPVSSDGEFYPLEEVELEPRPVQESIPLWISSNWVKRGLSRVAEYGDAWITNVPSVELFDRCWERIEQNAGEFGRDPSGIGRCLYVSVNLNDDEDASPVRGRPVHAGLLQHPLRCHQQEPAVRVRHGPEVHRHDFRVQGERGGLLHRQVRLTEPGTPDGTVYRGGTSGGGVRGNRH